MTCGCLIGPFQTLMEGGEGEIALPIPSFLIEHPKGRALYDTGMHPELPHQCRRDGWASALSGMFGFTSWGPATTSSRGSR